MKRAAPDKRLKDPGLYGGCVYYSQNREDLILLSFFPEKKRGFYVDVGAFDPDVDSVTKLFYLKGWRGINIEPQVDRWQLFKKFRPDDVNLNIGVSDKKASLTLRSYKSAGLSTFSETVKRSYRVEARPDTHEYQDTIVAVSTLSEILMQQKVTHIDFMKIDVEGFEYNVLAGNDWLRFRPEVLCLEANHIEHDWHPLLKQQGYELVFDDGLNQYFVDAKTNRKKKFNYIQTVVEERGGGIRAEYFDTMVAWRELAMQKAHHVDELAAENSKLRAELEAIHAYLGAAEGAPSIPKAAKLSLRQFFNVVKRRSK